MAQTPAAEREHERILSSYGGAYDDPRLEALITKTVDRLVAASDRPDLAYRVTILNSRQVPPDLLNPRTHRHNLINPDNPHECVAVFESDHNGEMPERLPGLHIHLHGTLRNIAFYNRNVDAMTSPLLIPRATQMYGPNIPAFDPVNKVFLAPVVNDRDEDDDQLDDNFDPAAPVRNEEPIDEEQLLRSDLPSV